MSRLQAWFGYEAPAWRRTLPGVGYALCATLAVLGIEAANAPAGRPGVAPSSTPPPAAGMLAIRMTATAPVAWRVLVDGAEAVGSASETAWSGSIPGAGRLTVQAELRDPLSGAALALRVEIPGRAPALLWGDGAVSADLALAP